MTTTTFIEDKDYEHTVPYKTLVAIVLKIYYNSMSYSKCYLKMKYGTETCSELMDCIQILTRKNFPEKMSKVRKILEYSCCYDSKINVDKLINSLLIELGKYSICVNEQDIQLIEETMDKKIPSLNVFLAIVISNGIRNLTREDFLSIYDCITRDDYKQLGLYLNSPTKANFIKQLKRNNSEDFYAGIHGHSFLNL